ncbi:MAG: hypothetical protein VCB07_06985 [Gammaproteobacteria bacterium]
MEVINEFGEFLGDHNIEYEGADGYKLMCSEAFTSDCACFVSLPAELDQDCHQARRHASSCGSSEERSKQLPRMARVVAGVPGISLLPWVLVVAGTKPG